MITYIVGVPGSGKSYFAVFKLWSTFIYKPEAPKNSFSKILFKFIKPKPVKNDYLYAYTNIDQFKFELDERFIKFDFDSFYSNLEILHHMYKFEKKTDAEIIEKAKELKLHKILFVIDECHNFLKAKDDPVLVWWLTYHRHLSHDLYLITQDLSLVSPEYKRIAEKFYRAIDSSKRLFSKTFKYAYFSSYKMNQCDRVNSFNINIPFNQEVFNLYHSGANSQSKSIVKFFVLLAVVLVVITAFLFIYFFDSSFTSNYEKDEPIKSESIQTTQSNPTTPKPSTVSLTKPELKPTYIYQFTCIDDICRFNDNHHTFPYSYISYLILDSKPIYFTQISKNSDYIEYFLVFNSPILDDLISNLNKKGASDEKDNISNSITPKLF